MNKMPERLRVMVQWFGGLTVVSDIADLPGSVEYIRGDVVEARIEALESWTPERLARLFHDTYEEYAKNYNWQSQTGGVVWEWLPENNRSLMLAVCETVLAALAGEEKPK